MPIRISAIYSGIEPKIAKKVSIKPCGVEWCIMFQYRDESEGASVFRLKIEGAGLFKGL